MGNCHSQGNEGPSWFRCRMHAGEFGDIQQQLIYYNYFYP